VHRVLTCNVINKYHLYTSECKSHRHRNPLFVYFILFLLVNYECQTQFEAVGRNSDWLCWNMESSGANLDSKRKGIIEDRRKLRCRKLHNSYL